MQQSKLWENTYCHVYNGGVDRSTSCLRLQPMGALPGALLAPSHWWSPNLGACYRDYSNLPDGKWDSERWHRLGKCQIQTTASPSDEQDFCSRHMANLSLHGPSIQRESYSLHRDMDPFQKSFLFWFFPPSECCTCWTWCLDLLHPAVWGRTFSSGSFDVASDLTTSSPVKWNSDSYYSWISEKESRCVAYVGGQERFWFLP